MTDWETDIAVLGSGFAGSLCGLILARGGLRTIVVDRAAHPRFAIGESSTPVANFVLRDLARQYELPPLLPLVKYGSWQRHYPQLVCGKKRGFSYFPHHPGEPFQVDPDHGNELLVAASHNDETSDTHWLRADVDAFFAQQLRDARVPLLERTIIREIRRAGGAAGGWELAGMHEDRAVRIGCRFLIDGTGEATVLPRTLGIAALPLATTSRAVFSHFTGLGSWEEWLSAHGGAVDDHPFSSDDAAQHHLLEGAWMWVLRFNNGVTSAGFAIDDERFPRDASLPPDQEWRRWLDRYPALQELFAATEIVDPPGRIVGTGRLPRRMARAAGPDWALLPHTAGFVDPLHSSGIAHSLCGVERLTHMLLHDLDEGRMEARMREYERVVFAELALIDQLVHGCYRAFVNFRLFAAYSMLYFAAATTYERRRAASGFQLSRWFLCAEDPNFRELVDTFYRRVLLMTAATHCPERDVLNFERDLAVAIRPFNTAGLCDPSVRNMYRYTAAPE